MPNNPLFHSVIGQTRSGNVRDQIQMALAIAEPNLLKTLLVDCIPAISELDRIGAISTQVGIPVGDNQSADGILHFEAVECVLADAHPHPDIATNGGWTQESKELARLTRHESEMQTLGQNLPLALAIALLAKAGFQPEQIDEILRLPHYAWHKSWWYTVDDIGQYTIPFLRCIRTLHYPDGSLTLQYKDFFAQEKPACFTTASQKVLVVIRSDAQGFAETLRQINRQREILALTRAVLICNTISELEAQAFISQGISVYPAMELVLPIHADCLQCARQECPMNGRDHSPVISCYGFLTPSEFV
jgi:bacterioferritin-associated ferredoxin